MFLNGILHKADVEVTDFLSSSSDGEVLQHSGLKSDSREKATKWSHLNTGLVESNK